MHQSHYLSVFLSRFIQIQMFELQMIGRDEDIMAADFCLEASGWKFRTERAAAALSCKYELFKNTPHIYRL